MTYLLQNITSDTNVADFDCGDADLNDYLKTDALRYAKEWVSATHILYEGVHPVGFCTLVWDSLQRDRIADDNRLPNYPYAKYPVIKLARLGVDLSCQNRGVGTELMISFFKIAKRAVSSGGGRFLTVDAKKNQRLDSIKNLVSLRLNQNLIWKLCLCILIFMHSSKNQNKRQSNWQVLNRSIFSFPRSIRQSPHPSNFPFDQRV